MDIIKGIFVLIVSMSFFIPVVAQSQNITTSNALSLDSSIRYGCLPNGFRYYIKSIDEPLSKLYLDLYVKVGGNQENENQMNFAHAIEHMAFKATKNYPVGIRGALKSKEIRMFDYSARSGDITHYYFKVPQHNEDAMDMALQWFKDIATGLELSEKDINQVRGELREEFLLQVGDELNEVFTNSRLESKLFPGRKDKVNFLEHHKTFKSEELQQFYRNWYRPDLMALSIVGNIEEVDVMEKIVKEIFSDIRPHISPLVLPDYGAAYYKRSPQFAIVERKTDTTKILSINTTEFRLFFRAPSIMRKIHTMEGIKKLIKLQLLINIANQRLIESTNEYNSFSAIALDRVKYNGLSAALEVKINADNGEKQALQKTIRVLHQLQKYGILKEEWNEIKKNRLRYLNSNDDEKEKYWINEIGNHFKYGEALPSNKQKSLKEWLSGLTLESFNDYVFQFLSEMPEDIGIIAPTGHKAVSLTEKEIRSWIREEYRIPVMPYKLPEIPKGLMGNEEIANLKKNEYVDKGMDISGARELLLNNGVRVLLKPNDITSFDKVQLHGFSPNGALSFPNRTQSSALNASNIVRNAGVGKMDKFALNRLHSNTGVQVSPYTGYMETGIVGSAASVDVEKMLQLIYLYFTNPRKDRAAFEDWKVREQNAYINPAYGLIQADFSNSIRAITGDNFLSRSPFSFTRGLMGTKRYEGTKNTKMSVAYKAYDKLFGNAKDFTFLISGEFIYDSITPLIQKYLGNLPNISELPESAPREFGSNSLPKGPVFKQVLPPQYYTMKNVSYATRFISKAENPGDWKEQLKVKALGKVAGKMGWNLRFKKGYKIYLIAALGMYNMDMERYEIGFNLSCSKEELPLIRKECRRIISEIKLGAISQELFEKSLKEISFKQNVQERLYEHYCYGQPWITPAEKEQFVKSLTKKDIMDTANKYCKEEDLFEFVMKNKGE